MKIICNYNEKITFFDFYTEVKFKLTIFNRNNLHTISLKVL